MRRHTRDARDRSEVIDCGWVEPTIYEFELCACDHHWYHYLDKRMKGTSDCSWRWKSMAVIILEKIPTPPIRDVVTNIAYHSLLFFVKKNRSGLGMRIDVYLSSQHCRAPQGSLPQINGLKHDNSCVHMNLRASISARRPIVLPWITLKTQRLHRNRSSVNCHLSSNSM